MCFRFDNVKEISWDQVNGIFREQFPNVLAVIDLLLTLPASSTEAERGFSAMKVVKTDWRSKLKDDSLSDLMMVKLQSAPILPKMDPETKVYY